MARTNNFPQAGLEKIDPKTVQAITMSLVDLYNKGKPKTDTVEKIALSKYELKEEYEKRLAEMIHCES